MQTVTLDVADWGRSQVAELENIPLDTTVGEILEEARETMSLSGGSYQLLFDGEKLSQDTTLVEIGVESGDELTIAPEVSAGAL
jgi:Ubiquitin-2 like Rad60 SUMO-like